MLIPCAFLSLDAALRLRLRLVSRVDSEMDNDPRTSSDSFLEQSDNERGGIIHVMRSM
jgi:hypothetical protein